MDDPTKGILWIDGKKGAFVAFAIGAYCKAPRGCGMRTLERLLVKFTMSLCNLFDVTPQHLEELRQKKQRPPRPEERYDYFEA